MKILSDIIVKPTPESSPYRVGVVGHQPSSLDIVFTLSDNSSTVYELFLLHQLSRGVGEVVMFAIGM